MFRLAVLVLAVFTSVAIPAQEAGFALGDASPAEGHAVLRWSKVEGVLRYEILDADGARMVAGPHTSFFVSGLRPGAHRFRLLGLDAAGEEVFRSEELEFVVTEPDWGKGWSLFGVGGVTTLLIILALLSGSRRPAWGEVA